MMSDAMILIRSVIFSVLFYASFIALMVFGSPCLVVSRAATLVIVRAWARTSVWLLAAICGTKVEFRNLHLMPKGASIIAAKHQSFFETFALILVLDDFAYILKKELMVIPFFGWYLKGSDQIAIDRAKRGATMPALQRAVREKLAAGRQIVIFPEGTRRRVSAPPLYKVGVSVLVGASGMACTPVALNSGLFWPRRSILRRPGTIVIEFLPPIPAGLDKREFMNRLQTAIEPATDALVADALAKDPDLARIVADAAREAQRVGASADMPPSRPKDHKNAAA